MKWVVLGILAAALLLFWPKNDAPEPSSAPSQKKSRSLAGTTKSTHTRRYSSRNPGQSGTRDLQDQITQQWSKIESGLSARDPRVVKFIRALRELGKRDGPGSLAFLDQLDYQDKEAEWIKARVAVAGGWALSDPAAAARALLEKNGILPQDYHMLIVNPNSKLRSVSPAHQSIARGTRQIFDRWAKTAPDEFKVAVAGILEDDSMVTFGIRSQLSDVAIKVGILSPTSLLDRNSIDAILNNPNRSASSFLGSAILRPTKEMNQLGEPAFTQQEWAARNPEHALAMIEKAKSRGEAVRISLITGLARGNDDYEKLLALEDPLSKMNIAPPLAYMAIPNPDEYVWLLDGRETTWTLSVDERRQAAHRLIANGNFSEEEREDLTSSLREVASGFEVNTDYGMIPELPNKVASPSE